MKSSQVPAISKGSKLKSKKGGSKSNKNSKSKKDKCKSSKSSKIPTISKGSKIKIKKGGHSKYNKSKSSKGKVKDNCRESASPSQTPIIRIPTKNPTEIPTISPTRSPPPTRSPSPTNICGLTPADRENKTVETITEVTDSDTIDNIMSPQNQALNWIVNIDEARLCPEDNNEVKQLLNQRYTLAVTYYSTNGNNWNFCNQNSQCSDGNSFLSSDDVCTWYGIACDNNGVVQEIRLGK